MFQRAITKSVQLVLIALQKFTVLDVMPQSKLA